MSSLARRSICTDFSLVSPLIRTRTCISVPRRLNSTQTGPYKRGIGSLILAGLTGGLTVIGLGYAWYHFSDVKKVVDTARRAKFFLQETRQSFIDRKNSNIALNYLRKVAKSYVAVLPGADSLVDLAFDSIDDIVDAHTEEATSIARSAYAEIQEIVKDSNSEQNPAKAIKVMCVLRRRLWEIQALGGRVGGQALGPLWEKFPEAGGKIVKELEELQQLVKDRGPDSTKMLHDAHNQVKMFFAEGANSEALMSARALIREKTLKLRGHKASGNGDGNITSGDEDGSGK